MMSRGHGASLALGLVVLTWHAMTTTHAADLLQTYCPSTCSWIASRAQPIYGTHQAAVQDCQRLAPVSATASDILSLPTLYTGCAQTHVGKIRTAIRPPLWVKSLPKSTSRMASDERWYGNNSSFSYFCEFRKPCKTCPATQYFPKLNEEETSPVICPQGELPYGGTTSTCRNGTHRVTGLTYCRKVHSEVQATVCRQTCTTLQTPAIPRAMAYVEAELFCQKTMRAKYMIAAPWPRGPPNARDFVKYVVKKTALNFAKITGVATEESQAAGCLDHHIRTRVSDVNARQTPFWISRYPDVYTSNYKHDQRFLASDGNRYPAYTKLPFVCGYQRTCNRTCWAGGRRQTVSYIPTYAPSNFGDAEFQCRRNFLRLPPPVPTHFPMAVCVNELLKEEMGTNAVAWMARDSRWSQPAYGSDGQEYHPGKRFRMTVCSTMDYPRKLNEQYGVLPTGSAAVPPTGLSTTSSSTTATTVHSEEDGFFAFGHRWVADVLAFGRKWVKSRVF
eukprot:scpid66369/ scgid3243/ 